MAKGQTVETRDAIDLLMDDHKRVDKLFGDFENVDRDDPDAVQELVEIACMELQIHSILEEEIFYPAVRAETADGDRDGQDLLNEAEVEHEMVDELIAKLQELEPDDAMYAAYFAVLAEYVKHHVGEEETELFPLVRAMSLDLQQLAEDMRLRREELFAEMEAGDEGDPDADSEPAAEFDEDALESVDEDEAEDAQEQVNVSRTRH
ncbi:MAG: hemerythrin protein [Betaproteobacteria bacterium]|nr:hemerythrin protein [Betaproteobacteria bacterium]